MMVGHHVYNVLIENATFLENREPVLHMLLYFCGLFCGQLSIRLQQTGVDT